MYKKTETYNKEKIKKIAKSYINIINCLGENPIREGLKKTPERCAKAIQFLTQGYNTDPDEILKGALFNEEYNQINGIRFEIRSD